MQRPKNGSAGYIPFVAVGACAAIGGFLATLIDLPQWSLAIPGMVAGYFVSRAILRRVYAPNDSN